MIYIIDGKNLYHCWQEKDVFQFFNQVSSLFLGKKKGNRIYLFMDGGPPGFYPDHFSFQGMNIHFTPGEPADKQIKGKLRSFQRRRDVILVSNDRELKGYARKYELQAHSCPMKKRPRRESKGKGGEKEIADKEKINLWLKKKWKIE